MPQLTQRTLSVINSSLAVGGYTLIPGMAVTLLTGAGWVDIRLQALVENTYAGINRIGLTFALDGVAMNDVPGAVASVSIPEDCWGTLGLHYAMRIGAGQHVLTALGFCTNANATIYQDHALFTVYELGF